MNKRTVIIAMAMVFALSAMYVVVAPGVRATGGTEYLVLAAAGCQVSGIREIGSNTNCWSSTSNGTGGAGVPDTTTDVVLDRNSTQGANLTGTIITTLFVHKWNASSFIGVINFSQAWGPYSGSSALRVSGDFINGGYFKNWLPDLSGTMILRVSGNFTAVNGVYDGKFGCNEGPSVFFGGRLDMFVLSSFNGFINATHASGCGFDAVGFAGHHLDVRSDLNFDVMQGSNWNIGTHKLRFSGFTFNNMTMDGVTLGPDDPLSVNTGGTFTVRHNYGSAIGGEMSITHWSSWSKSIIGWNQSNVIPGNATIAYTFWNVKPSTEFFLCKDFGGSLNFTFSDIFGSVFDFEVGADVDPLHIPMWGSREDFMSLDMFGCPSPPPPIVTTGSTITYGGFQSFPNHVTTHAATNIGSTTANLNGFSDFITTQNVSIAGNNLLSLGSAASVVLGGQLQSSAGVIVSSFPSSTNHANTLFQVNWTLVPACTVQQFRAEAIGTATSFWTDGLNKTVYGFGAFRPLNMGCGSASYQAFFEWGDTTDLGNTTTVQSFTGAISGANFAQTLTGLLANHTYYFRADVLYPGGTFRQGSILNFTTTLVPPPPPPGPDLLGPAINITWILVYIAILTLIVYGGWWLKRRRDNNGGSL